MTIKPNILIIQSDQHAARTMGCYGDPLAKTHNLDNIASSGARFTKCASNNPICAPFRGTMQTGLYSHTHGVVHNLIPLDPRLPAMGSLLSSAGYMTGYAGKWHLGRHGRSLSLDDRNVPRGKRGGWQFWRGIERQVSHMHVPKFHGDRIVDIVDGWEPSWLIETARHFVGSYKNKPWALYLSVSVPHPPPHCLDRFLREFDGVDFVVPDGVAPGLVRAYQNKMRSYYSQVMAMDTLVGDLLDLLREFGLFDNTLVVYVSDHGDRLGHHSGPGPGSLRGKGGPFHSEFNIPLIMQLPGCIVPGVYDTLADSVDLLPTILDIVGVPLLGIFQGQSLASWCFAGKGFSKPSIYLEHGLRAWRGIWDGQFVYSPNHIRPGFSNGIMYDHKSDPFELNNLINDPAYAYERVRLHRDLVELAKNTGDARGVNLLR